MQSCRKHDSHSATCLVNKTGGPAMYIKRWPPSNNMGTIYSNISPIPQRATFLE
ncbi:hypothetical protein Mapa_014028 [Marchantia paleacea]|nr:hypothetical protein Mapa_014028 [Marchantia paleacea]